MIQIFLTNLGKYNEDELVGKWVELPCNLEEELKEIGVGELEENRIRRLLGVPHEVYEEYFISDYEIDIEGYEISERESVEDLNVLAEKLNKMEDHEKAALEAMLVEGYDIEEALELVEMGSYVFYQDMTLEDVAYELADEMFNIPEEIKPYFNYKAFARDLEHEGYVETRKGVLVAY